MVVIFFWLCSDLYEVGHNKYCRLFNILAQVDRQDSGGRLPLHWATGHGHVEAVKAILDVGKAAKVNVKDKEGWTPLHRCCQQPPPPEKPKSEEEPPPPPIDMGAEDGRRAEIAAMLLEHTTQPADPSVFEVNSRNTPLHLCAMNGYRNGFFVHCCC